jgi:hypothetical protein
MIVVLACALGVPAAEPPLEAQISSGTVRGRVPGLIMKALGEMRITLEEVTTGTPVGVVSPDADGSFVFRNVPFAAYDVTAETGGVPFFSQRFDLRSQVPYTVFFDSTRTYRAAEILIEGTPRLVDRSPAAQTTHSFYTARAISSLPSPGYSRAIETVLLSTPGVVPDEDGRMHVRGEDAQLQYVVDGIPITGNLTRVYASLFNAALIKSVDIQTGGLNPEYGVATSGILAVTTKSGFDRPLFARAAASAGSFASRELFFEAGGNDRGSTSFYVAGSSSVSGRFLDPIAEEGTLASRGSARSLFGKLDAFGNGDLGVTLIGMMNETGFSIPNGRVKTPAQDQRQQLADYLLGGRLTYLTGPHSAASALFYRRHSRGEISSGGLSRLVSPSETAEALAQNENMFIGGARRYTTTGGTVDVTAMFEGESISHLFKAGLGFDRTPVAEFFSFAVTNHALADTAVSGGDARYLPYDLTQGGRPFVVDRSAACTRFSAYVQDEAALGRWTISGGVRFDRFSLLETETAFSPRLSIAYALDGLTTLRASYNRIVMQAPIENYLVSSSDEARSLTGALQAGIPSAVRSERAHVIEVGAARQMGDVVDLDLAGYAKFIDNFIAKVELGNSGVIFPVNLKQGIVAGGELRVRLHEWNNLSGFLSLGTCVSRGIVPPDGSSPFAAGLVLGEEGANYAHPFKGEDTFPTEHDQLLTASFGVSYRFAFGVTAMLGGRFDSGLPFDLTGPNGSPLDEAGSRAELLRRGYSEKVIGALNLAPETAGSPDRAVAPHAVIDCSVSIDMRRLGALPVRLTLTMLNLLDSFYLYKFESTFGGTHFGVPRTLTGSLEVEL